MGRSARPQQNSFVSGEIDPVNLLARQDLEQYRLGLLAGSNLVVLPKGGVRRRPGWLYLAEVAAGGRLVPFKFNLSQQYVFVLLDHVLWVMSAGAKITQVVTPWALADLSDLGWDCKADTTICTHEDYAPRRLVRSLLPANPITTTAGSTTVDVAHPNHGALAGDGEVGLSGLTSAIGGIPAAELATSHTVVRIAGDLAGNPLAVTKDSHTVRVTLAGHPFAIDDRVQLSGLRSIAGITWPTNVLSGEVNPVTVTDIAADWFEFRAHTAAESSTRGGGSAGTYSAPDRYRIVVTTPATSSTSGGGSDARGWMLTAVPLKNLPQFDFADEYSPNNTDETQRITFSNFATGDRFEIWLDDHKTNDLEYTGDSLVNARNLQLYLRALPNTSPNGIVVEHETGSPGSAEDAYKVKFLGEDGGKDWPQLGYAIKDSEHGLIAIETVAEGGQSFEDTWSTARGWPRRVLFHDQRLKFGGSRSRPSTRWASKVADYFNFDVGDGFEAEALSSTIDEGSPRIVSLAQAGPLWIFTEQNEVMEAGGQDGTITPDNVHLREQQSWGSLPCRPAKLDNAVYFADRRGKAIRQLTSNDTGTGYDAPDIAVFSSHLIKEPVDMATLRTSDGDYLVVANNDGTAAVMAVNRGQGVGGWTPCNTQGQILSLAEVDDWLYAIVSREVDGVTRYFLERMFDPSAAYTDQVFLDCAVVLTGPATTWTGIEHLEGATVQLKGDGIYLGTAVVEGGSVTTADEYTRLEVGLAYAPTLTPMPVAFGAGDGTSQTAKSKINGGQLDLIDSGDVYVNGRRIKQRSLGDHALDAVEPLLTGLHAVRCRGWSRRNTVTITQQQPMPLTVRSWEPWVAIG